MEVIFLVFPDSHLYFRKLDYVSGVDPHLARMYLCRREAYDLYEVEIDIHDNLIVVVHCVPKVDRILHPEDGRHHVFRM